jgi:hypothetical protein
MSAGNAQVIKLVFLRVPSAGSRKAVVPLVEGSDFEQFLCRVRSRLGQPDHARLTLCDTDGIGAVSSIDTLLEVEEGNTLDVTCEVAASSSSIAPVPSPSKGGAAHRSARHSIDPLPASAARGGGGAAHEYKVDVPFPYAASPRHGDDSDAGETGALKYRKRRSNPALRWAAFLVVGGLAFIAAFTWFTWRRL